MNEIAIQQQQAPATMGTASMLMNPGAMESLYRFAEAMASSTITVPAHLVGKPSDCLAIVMQAVRWGMDPFVVAQKTHVVSGRLGYEAQLVNAAVQASGAIRGAFRYEYQGDGSVLQCRVGAVLAGEQDVTWGEWLRSSDVQTKNSPLWKVNPKQQLGYLQVKNWSRLYCPGAILGVYTTDELDGQPAPAPSAPKHMGTLVGEPPAAPVLTDSLRERAENAALTGTDGYAAFFKSLSKDDRKALASVHEALKRCAAESDTPAEAAPVDEFVAALDAAE